MKLLKRDTILLVAFCTVCLVGSAKADIYRFVDANGVVHFTNTPTQSTFAFYARETGSTRDLAGIIRHYSRKFDLEEALVHAVIKVESDFNPKAVSSKGAQGLMQLIPETARSMRVANPFDMDDNVRGGCRYLSLMLQRFGGNLDLALAAYNAGPTTVLKYKSIPPFEETRNYVQKVKHYLARYRQSKDVSL